MFDNQFRNLLDQKGKFLLSSFIKLGIIPNQVTILGFCLSILSACFIATNHTVFGIIVWWASRLFDGLDGLLARETNQKTLFGGYLDILLDMASYSSIIIGFSFVYPQYNKFWLFILVGYILSISSTLALSSLIESKKQLTNIILDKSFNISQQNRSLFFTISLAEAGETSIVYTAFVVFPFYVKYIAIFWILLMLAAILQRSFIAYSLLKED